MGMANVDVQNKIVSLLIEAEKAPNPEKFVPVFDWDENNIWAWVKSGNATVLTMIPQGKVPKYAGKLGYPKTAIEYIGMIDPSTFEGAWNIYPWSWTSEDSLEPGQSLGDATTAVFKPPKMPKTKAGPKAAKPALPSNVKLTGGKDANGFPEAEDTGSGEEFSVLPDGRFGQWDDDDEYYYAVEKDEDGDHVPVPSPKWSLDQVKAMGVPKSKAKAKPKKKTAKASEKHPPDVELPAGFKTPPVKKTEPEVAAAKSTPQGGPSTEQPAPEKIVSSKPEPAPALTTYIGKTDINGLPLVDEAPEDPEDIPGATKKMTLLPDDRVSKWIPGSQYYLLYDYDPHFGYTYSKIGETVTPEEAKQQMEMLHLTVKNGKYHAFAYQGVETQQTTTFEVPLPPNVEKIDQKDPHGFPMVKSIPTDEDDDQHKLTLFPDARVGRWDNINGKYVVWEWRDILGDYNYYPTDPTVWVTLKQFKKLQAQLQPSPVKDPAPKPAPKPAPEPKAPEEPKGKLTFTGNYDPMGFLFGYYKGHTYTLLPHGKVGVWSSPNGAYLLYKYDDDTDSYYKTLDVYVPSSHHQALALTSQDDVDMATVADSEGTQAVVLPNGKFAKYLHHKKQYEILKVDVTAGKKFVPTGEVVGAADVAEHFTTKYKLMLKPTGEVDENGLSTYFPLDGFHIIPGLILTMLPNGDMGRWISSKEHYKLYEYDSKIHVWDVSHPLETFTLSDIDAMYLKAGTEKFKPEGLTKPKPAGATLDDILEPTGTFDEYGHEVFLTSHGFADGELKQVIKLPNNTLGWLMQVGPDKKYMHFTYNDKGEFVPANNEQTWLTPEEADQLLSSVKSAAQKAALATLELMQGALWKGYPKVKVTTGKAKGKIFAMLKNGLFGGMFSEQKQAFRLIKYQPDTAKWKYPSPAQWVTLDELAAMGNEPDTKTIDAASTLKDLKKTNTHGYPVFSIQTHPPGLKLAALPDGQYGQYWPTDEEYIIWEFDPKTKDWRETPNVVTLDQLVVKLPKPAPQPKPEPEPAPPKMPAEAPFVVPTGELPDPDQLTDIGPGELAGKGAGDKTKLKDEATGQVYVFKWASQKGAKSQAQPFKAHSQSSFATIASLVRPDAHVPVETKMYKGAIGTLQPYITDKAEKDDLHGIAPDALTEQQKKDVAEEHILDWIMSQHDSFGGNFLVTKSGRVLGIDKEQGWKYFQQGDYQLAKEQGLPSHLKTKFSKHPDELSTSYKPNTHLYGEQEPYYNKFWREFAEGKVDFDPKTMAAAVKRVDDVPSQKFVDSIQAYARSVLPGEANTKKRRAFLKAALLRKLNARADFETFVTKLYEKRTGMEGKFTFDEGWVSTGTPKPEKEKKDTGPKTITKTYQGDELKTYLASKYGIKEYPYMDPTTGELRPQSGRVTLKIDIGKTQAPLVELVDELGLDMFPAFNGEKIHQGPHKFMIVVSGEELAKAKLTVEEPIVPVTSPSYGYTSKYGPTPVVVKHWSGLDEQPESTPNLKELKVKGKDLEPEGLGKNVHFDGGKVEGQTGRVRKYKDTQGLFLIKTFKLRREEWKAANKALDSDTSQWTPATYSFKTSTYNESKGYYDLTGHGIHYTAQFSAYHFDLPEGDLYIARIGDSTAKSFTPYTYAGTVVAHIRDLDADVMSSIKKMLNTAIPGWGDDLMKPPTPTEKERSKLFRAAWAFGGSASFTLGAKTSTKKLKVAVEVFAKNAGYDMSVVDRLEDTEVFPGYHTHTLPGRWKKLAKGKTWFVIQSVSSVQGVVGILKHGAILSISQRNQHGLPKFGMSYPQDSNSGAGDQGMCRIVSEPYKSTSLESAGHHYGKWVMIVHPDVLDRLDIYYHYGDSWGKCNPSATAWKSVKSLEEATTTSGYSGSGSHYKSVADSSSSFNEIMIRQGVPASKILRVGVQAESLREEAIDALKYANIEKVNGMSVEDFVVVCSDCGAAWERYVKPVAVVL